MIRYMIVFWIVGLLAMLAMLYGLALDVIDIRRIHKKTPLPGRSRYLVPLFFFCGFIIYGTLAVMFALLIAQEIGWFPPGPPPWNLEGE